MAEVVQGNFPIAQSEVLTYFCPAFGKEGVACAQLFGPNQETENGVKISNERKVALCAASLSIADELPSSKACCFQKFIESLEDNQARIQYIVEGAENAT